MLINPCLETESSTILKSGICNQDSSSFDESSQRNVPNFIQQQFACSLYFSRIVNESNQHEQIQNYQNHNLPQGLSRSRLENGVVQSEPTGYWSISQTQCGLIVAFNRESDADNFLQKVDLALLFECPVQVLFYFAHK